MNALVAFEAAARHESFTRAAEELCVTQGAVSHQVKALEAELGIKLFARKPQRLTLTVAGNDYYGVAREALDRVAAGTGGPAQTDGRADPDHAANLRTDSRGARVVGYRLPRTTRFLRRDSIRCPR